MPDASSHQARADQVRAFQAELEALEAEGVLQLSEEQRRALAAHHGALLTRLGREGGADSSDSMRQLSMGLRLATLLGTVALGAAVVFFVFQFWADLPTPGQLGLGMMAPLVPLGLAELAARREQARHLGHLFLVVATAGFALNLELLHRALNLPMSPHPALALAVFTVPLAYRFGNRPVLMVGLLAGGYWVAASLYGLTGGWYADFPVLPETMLAPAVVITLLPSVLTGRLHPAFAETYRLVGLVVLGLVAAVVSLDGSLSLLPFGVRGAEIIYTLAGFTLGVGALVMGVRRGWHQTASVGTGVLLLFMVVKAVDWWWSLMPAWVFFLLLGGLALASIAGLRRLRTLAVGPE